MVLFNYSTKELTAKVVYYGPGLCGKTTNLQWVHEKLPIKNKGKMLSLATETDRTLFFDFLPIEIGSIRGMKTRIQLYTVPGQVFYNATRRMVLKGADAVVFVCDSQEAMLDANLESFENMRQNLEANELDPDEIPIVLQYNKRDLPNALPIEILNERMNPHNYVFNEAIAVTGVGVEDTLKSVTKLVFKSLSVKYGEGATAPGGSGGVRSSSPPVAPVSAPPVASAPPRAVPPAPAAPSFADGEEEDLLADLSMAPAPPAPAAPFPPVEFEKTPASAFGAALSTPAPPAALAEHPPQGTLISSQDEAAELRRRIANPGIPEPEVEVEMDLEELDEVSEPTHGELVPEAPPAAAPPAEPPPVVGRAAEVEVPIDIEVAPGTTRVSLNLRLVLNLKSRR
jgi:signal recognition particle receptor subunit beta